VEHIEDVKTCSLNLGDMESFVQNEFELINVKEEHVSLKVKRFDAIIEKFLASENKILQSFDMHNPLIKVTAIFHVEKAEVYDLV
jgi:hypothetical protein